MRRSLREMVATAVVGIVAGLAVGAAIVAIYLTFEPAVCQHCLDTLP